MRRSEIQHLYWRAGFGISPVTIESLRHLKRKVVVNKLFDDSASVTLLTVDTSEIQSILNLGEKLSSDNRRKIQELSRKKSIELNQAWINRLVTSKEMLREKMTLFWANVFVCEDNNTIYIQRYNNMLRKYALGNFGEFVKAVSKEAAMTKYLNTKQNRKQKPNENFARELMELFTLGEGHYTEQDIKESARAFTGYSHNLKGDFVFRKFQHDNGNKTFFGKTGIFKGDDIIDIILEQRQCAQFICEKIYSYFVHDRINQNHVKSMVKVFYRDYDIEKLMRFVMLSDWFYNQDHMGSKIKSPIEFLVGLQKVVPVTFKNKRQLMFIQKQLGQVLLDPPNVAGWKGGKNWIDSNTIVIRLKLPSLILNDAFISKSEDNQFSNEASEMIRSAFKKRVSKQFKTDVNWDAFEKQFKNVSIEDLSEFILCCDLQPETSEYLKKLDKISKKEYCIQLMSLPEYQMC
ncbi:DUF1800 domain-containing protein [Gaetbulibacter saemankumensis]|uniref:DUF1800 domain-containing protein n=1 Tax=Gaetbulibacter saemankumensis TaxID=311208 RepID=UPI0004248778|nr:DUF1800 domain-containing protein [Gaetbulibacter saemankumensis]